jgi:hypothetical protein
MFYLSLKTDYRPTIGQTGTLHKEYMRYEQNKMEKMRNWWRKIIKWIGNKFGKKEGRYEV